MTSFLRVCIFLVSLLSAASAVKISKAYPMASKGTYPRAIVLRDGSLLGTVSYKTPNSPAGYQVITTVISRNNGTSWKDHGVVINAPGDNWNQFLLQLPNGRVLCAFHDHQYKADQKTFAEFRITIYYSDDLGKTWKLLSRPEVRKAKTISNGMWEPFLRFSKDKVLQLFYSSENHSEDQNSLMRTSADGGKTWSAAKTISGSDVRQRDGMLGVANYGGKKLIAVFETTVNGHFEVWSITSPDDGKTWGNRRRVYATKAKNANAGSPQVNLVGNTLVCSFMTDEEKPIGWASGAAMKIVMSVDGGASWHNKTTIFTNEPSTFWPGMYTLDKNNFLAMAAQNGPKVRKVQLR
ncbi:Sialidase [Auriculariales sp. MPI-PUGE-AT-0066]|nr:Sialidase [Auriculariales sp. MPI-PUGE-AT-0066]